MATCRSLGSLVFAGLIMVLLPALAAGQPASLLRDIKTDGGPFDDPVSGGGMSNLMVAGDKLYFAAADASAGRELWVSDGTASGTEVVRDLCPGGCSSTPDLFGNLGGLMLFSIELSPQFFSVHRRQLWRSDGTRPGTFALTDTSIDVSSPFAFFHGALYFIGCSISSREQDCDLWQTDGSAAGTRIFQESPSFFEWLQVAGDRLYYLAKDDQGSNLWVTDGTAAGTRKLHGFAFSEVAHAQVSAGGRLFLLAATSNATEVWTSDGTVAGTRALKNFPGPFPFLSSFWLKPVGNRVYFVANDVSGRQIWRTDGTPAGTVRLTGMPASAELFADDPSFLAEVGNRVVFVASHGESIWLWSTQGKPQSTAPLPGACAGCSLDRHANLIESGGRVFFLVEKNHFETSLWTTDGTAAGTRETVGICNGCSAGPLQPWKEGILFPVGSPAQIWFSDGTPERTRLLVSPIGASPLSNPFEIAELGDNLYYFAAGESQGLWVQGAAGNRPVFNLPIVGPTSNPLRLTSFANQLLFTAEDSAFSDGALWSSAGTPETTNPVSMPSVSWEDATDLVPAGGLTYFQIGSFAEPHNLWRTDGTAQGTFVVAHLQAKAVMVPFNGALYFFDGGWIWRTDGTVQGTVKTGELPASLQIVELAVPGPNGMYLKTVTAPGSTEFWITDGTTAGTRQLTHFNENGVTGADPEFTRLGSFMYFTWRNLWRTDGTPQGTVELENLYSVGDFESPTKLVAHQGALYFFTEGFTGDTRLRLWRTDGTPAGTIQLGLFTFQDTSSSPVKLTPFNGKLYFNVDDGVHGIELWATDGTPAGTALVRDLCPGSRSSSPTQLTVAGNRFFFTAGEDVHGNELWQSDGTAAGTRMVQDIGPQAYSSAPRQLTVAGDKLYFTADDGVTGREVWVLPLSGPTTCQPSSTRLCLSGGRYAVEAAWRDFEGHRGVGHAVALTSDTGYFWFFGPSNVEAVLKVLDGRAINNHVWVFYGALSTVEYSLTVMDTETGLTHRYVNPSGQLASVGDTASFGPLGATTAAVTTSVAPPSSSLTLVNHRVVASKATGTCSPSSTRLCLNNARFAVEIAWKDFEGHTGHGQAVELTSDTGWFWFFGPDNVEVMLKVLDGTPINGHHWVFYGALSSVEYTVTVTDTQMGEVNTYRNPSGQFASVADTGAF